MPYTEEELRAAPEAVREQYRQAMAEREAMKNAPQEPETQTTQEASEETPAQPEQATETAPAQPEAELAPPVEQEQPEVEVKPEPPAPEDQSHAMKTMQGRHRAEMERAKRREETLERRIAELEESNRKLIDRLPVSSGGTGPETPANQAKDAFDPAEYGLDEERDGDILPYFEQLHKTRMKDQRKYEERIKQLEEQVSGAAAQVAQTAEERFYYELDQQVPEWRDINGDPLFHDWLSTTDDGWGQPVGARLGEAGKTHDVRAAVKIFRDYEASQAQPAPPPKAPPAPAMKPKASLVAQAMPNTGAPDPAPSKPSRMSFAEYEAEVQKAIQGMGSASPATRNAAMERQKELLAKRQQGLVDI